MNPPMWIGEEAEGANLLGDVLTQKTNAVNKILHSLLKSPIHRTI